MSLILVIFASLKALKINILLCSTINKNRKGYKGKPYMMPLEALKNLIGDPFISTKFFSKLTYPIIQLVIFKFRLLCIKINLKSTQSTLSYV